MHISTRIILILMKISSFLIYSYNKLILCFSLKLSLEIFDFFNRHYLKN